MSDFAGTNWDDKEQAQPHPASEQLLLYVDGELTDKDAGQVRAHLEVCWKCRARVAGIEETIAEFSRFDETTLTRRLPPPPGGWRGFDARLKRLVAENGRPSLLSRLRGLRDWLAMNIMRTRLTVGLAFACVVAACGIWLMRTPQVSARELLQRSIRAEAARVNQFAEPVMYRKVQVRRKGDGGEESLTWESWRSAKGNQFRQRVADKQGLRFLRDNEKSAPALIVELEQVFQSNRLDAQRPLSTAAYAEWRAGVRLKSETVTDVALTGGNQAEGRGGELKLTTIAEAPYAANKIIEASLIVRKSDWHVVAQHLKAQGENEIREYELREMAYEILPLEALTVFADLAPAPSPGVAAAPLASPPRLFTPSPKATPAEAELKEAEIAALYALHQAQADLGEQIEVTRDPAGRVIVQGLVEQAARKQQLTDALENIPLVTMQIQTVEEAARQAETKQPSMAARLIDGNEPAITAAPATPAANAFQQRLEQYFAGRGDDRKNAGLKAAQLSNAVLTEASASLSEAWALRRLAERFAAAPESETPPAARQRGEDQRIAEMMGNHLARLKVRSRLLRARLEPILTAIGGPDIDTTPAPRTESTRQARALAVFNNVQLINQLVGRLFAGIASDPEMPEQSARRMLSALANLDRALQDINQ
ncbi:MAG: anti-sigma factor family protein [Blastocatellia bacterium]